MIKEYSEELAKLFQKRAEEQIGFKGTINAKIIYITKFDPGDHEHWIAAIGNDVKNPEEFVIEITIKGVDKTGKALDKTVTLMKKHLGIDVRIAIKEIPLYFDKDNYHQSMASYWGMVREPPSIGDFQNIGVFDMLFGGKQQVWYSKLNHAWILASGKEMAAYCIPNLPILRE